MFRRSCAQKVYIRKISCLVALICSEGPIFSSFFVQKVVCSEGSMFRKFNVQKVPCSKFLYSEDYMFRMSFFKKRKTAQTAPQEKTQGAAQ